MNAWFRYSLWALLNLRKNSWSLLILSFRVMTTTGYWRGIKLNIRSALWYLRDAEMQIWSRSVAQLWGGGELDSPSIYFFAPHFQKNFSLFSRFQLEESQSFLIYLLTKKPLHMLLHWLLQYVHRTFADYKGLQKD